MSRKKLDCRIAAVVAAILCSLFPFSGLARAQQTGAPPPQEDSTNQRGMRTVIKQTQHVDVRELEKILGMLGLQIRLKPDINAIVLRGHDSNDIDTALRLIEALDVPPEPGRAVEITVFVVAASKDGTENVGITAGLAAAVDQLRTLFGYRGFELLDTVFLRVLDTHGGRVEGGLVLDAPPPGVVRVGYELTFNRAEIIPRGDDERLVRLDGLTFELNGTDGGEIQRAYLKTDVEIREGQKAVVGKSTPRGVDDTLILILEARVLD